MIYRNDEKSSECAREIAEAGRLLNCLRGLQGETHDALGQIEDRLSEVLLPAAPAKPPVSNSATRPITSPICEEIGYRLDAELNASLRIKAIINRLTV